jgi:hypothetical protein
MPYRFDTLDDCEREWLWAIRRRSARPDRVAVALMSAVVLTLLLVLTPAERPWHGGSAALAGPAYEERVVADGRRALDAWGRFEVTNNLTPVRRWFWANGPQFQLLLRQARLRARQPQLGLPPYRFTLILQRFLAPSPGYRVLSGRVRVSRVGETTQLHWWDLWMRQDPASDGRWRLWTVARPGLVPEPTRSARDPVVVAAGDISPGGTRGGALATSDRVLAIRPTAVLTLGDNQYPNGSLAYYRWYYHLRWGRFKAKTRPIPGNHEYETPGAAGYFGYFSSAARPAGRSYYSFDLGGWHLIALDSQVDRHADSAQVRWLRADLLRTSKRCILAYWHYPRFTSGGHEGNNLSVAPFWEVLYLAGANIVLSGHEHNYERFAPQDPGGRATPHGIRQFVVGTGGASLMPFGLRRPNSQVRRNDTWGVLVLTLHSAAYSWRFVSEDGDVLDHGGPVSCQRARPARQSDSGAASRGRPGG